jgi:hypothetical protein
MEQFYFHLQVKYAFAASIFTKLELIQQLFVKNSCIRFLANLMDGLFSNTRSQTEGSMLSQHYFFTW